MASIQLSVPEDLLNSTGLSEHELLIELALQLFREERLSAGKASELAGLDIGSFYRVAGTRGITVHYDVDDLVDDLKHIASLKKSS